jgi:hypothetical protein
MSSIVYTHGKGRKGLHLAAGLRWVILDMGTGSKPSPKKIRAQAQPTAASRYVVNRRAIGPQGTEQTSLEATIGLYNEPIRSSTDGLLYSLSMVVLGGILRQESLNPQTINVALLMEPQGAPHLRVMVFIQNAQVILDSVLDKTRAIELLKEHVQRSGEITIYCEHPEIPLEHTPITWPQIVSLADKKATAALLRTIPATPYPLLVFLVLSLAVSGWFAYDHYVREPEKKRRIALALAARDQTPVYVAAAQGALRSTGWERADVLQFLASMRERSVLESGWVLKQMFCDIHQCTTQWERRGGLLTGLAAARPAETILSNGTTDITSGSPPGGPPALEKAITQFKHSRKVTALEVADLPYASSSMADLITVAQKFSNAGIGVTIRDMHPWEVIPTTDVEPLAILRISELEMTLMPHQVRETLDSLPKNTLVQSVRLNVADVNSFTLDLRASSYASPNK